MLTFILRRHLGVIWGSDNILLKSASQNMAIVQLPPSASCSSHNVLLKIHYMISASQLEQKTLTGHEVVPSHYNVFITYITRAMDEGRRKGVPNVYTNAYHNAGPNLVFKSIILNLARNTGCRMPDARYRGRSHPRRA